MKKAVTALIYHPITPRLILGVSRKDNPNDFGLIGGKLDLDETWDEALLREVQEETGLVPVEYESVFELTDTYKGIEYFNRTYLVYQVKDYNIQTIESGIVSWIPWSKLTDDSSSFKEYNKALYEHLKAMSFFD